LAEGTKEVNPFQKAEIRGSFVAFQKIFSEISHATRIYWQTSLNLRPIRKLMNPAGRAELENTSKISAFG
jgi:hypothetical protein